MVDRIFDYLFATAKRIRCNYSILNIGAKELREKKRTERFFYQWYGRHSEIFATR